MRLLKNSLSLGVFVFSLLTLAFSTPAFAVQSVTVDTTLSADGSQNGANFAADATLTAPSGTTINIAANANGVTTATNNTGSLTFAGGASTVTGVVGTSGTALKAISAGVAGSTTTFSGNVFNTTTNVVSTGTITFNGNLTGTTVNYNADGDVQLADTKTLTAAITTNTTNTGSLSFLGAGTMTGQVGTSANLLRLVNGGLAGKTVTFANDVFATTTNVSGTGTLALNGNLTGTTVNYNADGDVQLADAKNITAAITTNTNATGSLSLLGTNTVS